MKFFINTISETSARANIVNMTFVETATLLDGLTVNIYAPKSVELSEGVINDIPYFLAKNVFSGFSYRANLKSLGKQLQSIAPAGKKREYKARAAELLEEVSNLNIEVEVEPTGEFVGKIGDDLIVKLKPTRKLSTNTYVDNFHWRQKMIGNGLAEWVRPEYTYHKFELVDENGNIFIVSTTSEKLEEFLCDNIDNIVTLTGVVSSHNVFRNKKQTILKGVKRF